VRLWEDSINGKRDLINREYLAPLKIWMEGWTIHTLFDILEWDNTIGVWKG
jgi:hypothetical protein